MVCTNCQREIADYSNFCYFCGARQQVAPAYPPRGHKRLMRSSVDHKIAGVCGGIAEYLEIDSTIVRLVGGIMALLPILVVPAVIGYVVAWIIMPLAPSVQPVPPAGAAHSTTA